MSRILIGFASHYGQTRKISERLREHLRAAGHEVELADLSRGCRVAPPPEDYDVVVLGSRVELGKHAPCVREYAHTHAAALREIPVAVFSVSMSAANRSASNEDPNGYLAALCTELGIVPARRTVFAGALRYRSYRSITRFVMKLISRRAGHPTDTSRDHELTDWAAVRAFAVEISSLCDPTRAEAVAG